MLLLGKDCFCEILNGDMHGDSEFEEELTGDNNDASRGSTLNKLGIILEYFSMLSIGICMKFEFEYDFDALKKPFALSLRGPLSC